MIIPVVANLLRIYALHSRKFFLNPSIIYHPGQENCMADNASRLFYLSDTEFLIHMSIVHPQLHGLWQIFLPPLELLSCVISTLHRKPYEPALLKIRDSRGCTGSGPTSVPPCCSILLSKIHASLTSSSSKATATMFGARSTPSDGWTELGNNWFIRHGGDCNGPPPGWSARPEKTCTLSSTHRY